MSASSSRCRSCGSSDVEQVLDFGDLPLGNVLLDDAQSAARAPRHPLSLELCNACAFVQTGSLVPPERLLAEVEYFTSASSSVLRGHEERFAADLFETLGLSSSSRVVEIGSNDGRQLEDFKKRGARVVGVEPVASSAELAEARGIPTLRELFTSDLVPRLREQIGAPDVAIANYVLEIVPDPNDFTAGLAALLQDGGAAVIEVPYIRSMVESVRFDGIAHLRVNWFNLHGVRALFARHGMRLEHAAVLPKFRGGTLRFVARRGEPGTESDAVARILAEETDGGITSSAFYRSLTDRIAVVGDELRAIVATVDGSDDRRIAAYGAGIKASTLLNVLGLDARTIAYTVDINPAKHGKYLPGVRVPVHPPAALTESFHTHTLLLALDLAAEVLEQQEEYRRRGGRFITPVPEPTVI